MSIPKEKMHLIESLAREHIAEIIRHYVGKKGLRQRQVNKSDYVGRCPFHNEKSPSFTVTTTKGFYHCFGCGCHGEAIQFVREFQNYSYMEAVLAVAKILGIHVPSGHTNARRARRRYRGKKRRQAVTKQKAIPERSVLSPLQESWQRTDPVSVDPGDEVPF